MKTLNTILLLLAVSYYSLAQDAKSLETKIESHYDAIMANDLETVLAQHRDDMTLYASWGADLMNAEEMANAEFPEIKNAKLNNFSAKIYDNIGVALFQLQAQFGGNQKTLGVTAVWIWQDGDWKEAHHHESELIKE